MRSEQGQPASRTLSLDQPCQGRRHRPGGSRWWLPRHWVAPPLLLRQGGAVDRCADGRQPRRHPAGQDPGDVIEPLAQRGVRQWSLARPTLPSSGAAIPIDVLVG